MKNNIILTLIIGMILFSAIILANAQEYPLTPNVDVTAPTLWERFLNLFRRNEFTIVGQDRLCDSYANYKSGSISGISQTPYFISGHTLGYWSFPQGTVGGSSQTYASRFCSSGHGLYDVYCQTNLLVSPGQLGTPRFEMKDSFYFTCTSSCAKCNVELYCCPEDCSTGDSCVSGSVCTTKTATDPYMPLLDPFNGAAVNSYSYCKALGCSGVPTTCWRPRADKLDCESTTYTCEQLPYRSSCPIGSYTYSSKSTCVNNLPPPTCVPNNACASNTCVGKTCINNCGSVVSGTKTDGICATSNTSNDCEPDWKCDEFGECKNNIQVRNCTDINNCSDDTNRPLLSQPCNNTNCTPNWYCYDWGVCSSTTGIGNQTRTCVDSKNCGTKNPHAILQKCTADCTPECDNKCGGVPSNCLGITCDAKCENENEKNDETIGKFLGIPIYIWIIIGLGVFVFYKNQRKR